MKEMVKRRLKLGKDEERAKRRYLPTNYHRDIYLKIHYFKQQDSSMENYLAEFVNLIINGHLQEFEDQVIARYLVGLRFNIARVIFMQPYNTLHDVIKLALKIEDLNKYGSSITTKSVAKERFAKGLTYWNNNGSKTILTPQVKIEVH